MERKTVITLQNALNQNALNLPSEEPDTIMIFGKGYQLGKLIPSDQRCISARESVPRHRSTATRYNNLLYALEAYSEGKLELSTCADFTVVRGHECTCLVRQQGDGLVIDFSCPPKYSWGGPAIGLGLFAAFLTMEDRQRDAYCADSAFLMQDFSDPATAESVLGMLTDAFYWNMDSCFTSVTLSESPETVNMALSKADMLSNLKCSIPGVSVRPIHETASFMSDAPVFQDSELRDQIMKGKFFVSYTPDSALQEASIPDVSFMERIVLDETFSDILSFAASRLNRIRDRLTRGMNAVSAIGQDFPNLIISGVPGTGKSTYAKALAASLRLPFYAVPCAAHTEEDTFTGKTVVENGVLRQVPTPFLEAFMHGGVVVLEEANLVHPGILMGTLSQALVPPFLLLRNGYEPVIRHPQCIVIMTMNPGLAGTQEQNHALFNRCPTVFMMNGLSLEKELEAIRLGAGLDDDEDAGTAVLAFHRMYEDMLNWLHDPMNDADSLTSVLSQRNVIAAVRAYKDGMPVKRAAIVNLINPIYNLDREIGEMMMQTFDTKLNRGLNYCPTVQPKRAV